MLLEICVDSIVSVQNAIDGGADRLELCSSLPLGGLTPTLGLLKESQSISPDIPIYAMLRPRPGNFVYSEAEARVILADLAALKEAGVHGFVFGALTWAGALDPVLCRKIIDQAAPLPVTLHRAIDVSLDWRACLASAVEMGFTRVLSSGTQATAMEGADTLKAMKEEAGDGLVIMAGCGVNSGNVSAVVGASGVREVHASASMSVPSPNNSSRAKMGSADGETIKITSKEEVRLIKDALAYIT